MCTRGDCVRYMGRWVQFQTPWGSHRGIVSDMTNRAVLMRVPRGFAPAGLATAEKVLTDDDEKRLDLALTQWGYGGGYGGYGYGRRGYGAGWGYPGYGGWYGGWWWWWLAFASIFWLAFLW
jgi:hypothetical protein